MDQHTMASFKITQLDLLIMSMAALACIKTELLANRVVDWLAPMLASRSSVVRTLTNLHKQKPGLLAKILMEQITLWTIIVVILVALTYTSVPMTPFSHQPKPYPTFLIRFILDASVARFVVMAARIMLVRDVVMSQTRSTATPGQSGCAKLDFIYNLVGSTCNLVYLGYHENLLLSLTAPFMEWSSTPLECCRLIEDCKKSSGSRSYKKTTILSFAICLVSRAILPLILLILATTKESPLRMDDVPLATFFICSIFYSSFNLLILYHSFVRMWRTFYHSGCDPFQNPSQMPMPFCIQVISSDNNHVCQVKNDNYGFVHPSDNGDLYCTLSPEDSGQMSFSGNDGNFRHSSLQRIVKNSDGDMFGKFRFGRYLGSSLDKSRSQDLLLGSQEFLSDNEPDVPMVGFHNEYMNYQQSEVDQASYCEDYQPSGIDKCRDSENYRRSTIDEFNQSVEYQQSDNNQSGESEKCQQSDTRQHRRRNSYQESDLEDEEAVDNSTYLTGSSVCT